MPPQHGLLPALKCVRGLKCSRAGGARLFPRATLCLRAGPAPFVRRGRVWVSADQQTAPSELNCARGAAGISAAAFEGFGYFLSITAVGDLKDVKCKTELC